MDAAPAGTSPDTGIFVLFERGARTNLAHPPEGQTLYVVTGEGIVQKEGDQVAAIGTGDLVYFSPGEKHWHGAAPDTFTVHIAISPASEMKR